MSLVGNLEDLGLGDILQIVSLSRKSGVLHLEQDTREGAIIFRDGQVVCAYSTKLRRPLGELLVEQGMVTPAQLAQAVETWTDSGKRDSLSSHIERDVGTDHEQIQSVIRSTVEKTVYHLFRWREGTFNFELKDVEEELKALDPDDAQLVLDVGLNPQYLAMEGARLQDESGMEGAPEEEDDDDFQLGPEDSGPVAAPPEPEPAAAPPAAAPAPAAPAQPPEAPAAAPVGSGAVAPVVLLIDDDGLTLSLLEKKFAERGFAVQSASNSAEGMAAYDRLAAQGKPVYLVVDLLMPRSDGAGILGGLEVLEFIRGKSEAIHIVLVTDYDNEDARQKAQGMKVDAFLRKPRRAQLNPDADTPELSSFLDELGPMLATWAAKEPAPPAAPAPAPAAAPAPVAATAVEPDEDDFDDDVGEDTVNIRDELAKEFEDGFFTESAAPQAHASRGLAMLKAMTDELNDPNSSMEIT
ncbi:MAG: DUF4388 domain-containing protein, partial [Chrysiogenetes bacterium]|nr:DUF4388 domain-containing protein [Chrysiogenetes bacterium]